MPAGELFSMSLHCRLSTSAARLLAGAWREMHLQCPVLLLQHYFDVKKLSQLWAQIRGTECRVLHRNKRSPQISTFERTCLRLRIKFDHVSSQIGFNAVICLKHLESWYMFPASFSNIWTCLYSSFDMSSLYRYTVTVHFVHFCFLFFVFFRCECAGGFGASMWSRAPWHHGLLLFRATECAPLQRTCPQDGHITSRLAS